MTPAEAIMRHLDGVRKRKNIKLWEMVEPSGMSIKQISASFKRDDVHISTVFRIAEGLGVKVKVLFEDVVSEEETGSDDV